MTENGRRVIHVGLWIFTGVLGLGVFWPDRPLGPPHLAWRCLELFERPGEGILCRGYRRGYHGEGGGQPQVPRFGDRTEGELGPERLALFEVPLDLNRATVEQLQSLPGIGPGLAARLVAARPFRSVGEVMKVKGIGRRRALQLRARLYVQPTTGLLEGPEDPSGPETESGP